VIATDDVIENVYFLREVENSAKAVVAIDSSQIVTVWLCVCVKLESIELIIVDHPFSPANDLAPRPSTSSSSPGRKLSLFLFFIYLWSKPESIE
jgi:hypothetical protein